MEIEKDVKLTKIHNLIILKEKLEKECGRIRTLIYKSDCKIQLTDSIGVAFSGELIDARFLLELADDAVREKLIEAEKKLEKLLQ